ncbi:hypothetical protein DQ384_14670 [Sphaerisporangium album]|uniref:Thiopeptide-type bacteriocin biosynthesis domain-containing protein n=1 Tax=Sphaerisporangium album TaxID=509200 RepID=A0A367FLF1_9ACTN|nr:thiopeptide-type bacteriocin biosynthesis protein [Sphaerisporangium album]RCG30547.1 hypothetical protein DQ384_14670 [Sphaerisporangium album]
MTAIQTTYARTAPAGFAGPGTDWWYVRAYPGHADLMDDATRVLLPWLRAQAAGAGAPAWYFTRYFDMTGHHLRLRLACAPEVADRLHERVPEILGMLHELRGGPAERLVPGSVPTGLPSVRRVRPCLYAPELAKYGGPRGAALAEELFTAACEWYVDNDLAGLAPLYDRAAVAVAFMGALVPAALGVGQVPAFWAAHRRQWGLQLRMSVPRPDDLRALLSRASAGIRAAGDARARLRRDVGERVDAVAAALDRAGREGNPVERPVLLLHYLHMEMNRWGFVPAEECLLGILVANQFPPK